MADSPQEEAPQAHGKMMRYKWLGILLLWATAVWACTSALIGAGASASGHPILWKHRDSGFEQNFIERVAATDSTFGYVALFNGGDSLLLEAWTGMNDRGFAVMNTASYNLVPDTAQIKDREGIIMTLALRKCRSVNDFATLLDTLPRPLGVQANFGVLDSSGAGAYFETGDNGYVRFDIAADSVIVRTNFSCSGTCGEGLGRVRYANAVHMLPRRNITPQLLTDTISRSFYHSELGLDPYAQGWREAEDRDFIPRRSTSASIAIELGPEPVMWVILGYPPLSVAQRVTLDSIPQEMRPILPGAISPLCDRNVRQRRQIMNKRNGKWIIDFKKLSRLMKLNQD